MSPSEFLDLPQELKDMIAGYALHRTEPLRIATSEHSEKQLDNALALTQTCRALRPQCSKIFYRSNTFNIELTTRSDEAIDSEVGNFLRSIGPDSAKHLGRIDILVHVEHFGILNEDAFASTVMKQLLAVLAEVEQQCPSITVKVVIETVQPERQVDEFLDGDDREMIAGGEMTAIPRAELILSHDAKDAQAWDDAAAKFQHWAVSTCMRGETNQAALSRSRATRLSANLRACRKALYGERGRKRTFSESVRAEFSAGDVFA